MIQILSHRGCWTRPEEKNSKAAFHRSFVSGFGTETDFRDHAGSLIVAHDPSDSAAMAADAFFALHSNLLPQAVLALNIKADGLCSMLKQALQKHAVANYFCFDMSVPETVVYRRERLRYFTRESEYEPHPPLYEDAAGVWMDMFHTDWIKPDHIRRHLNAAKQVVLVSPDLHGRPHHDFWEELRSSGMSKSEALMICTDYPEEARKFFYA
jgi:hypothetical protein